MKNDKQTILLYVLLIITLFLLGCAATSDTEEFKQPEQQKAETEKSALSYGMVNATVQTGVTSQIELIRLFGGPNISTTDADGSETWVYARTVNETDFISEGTSKSNCKVGVKGLDVFFTLGILGAEYAQVNADGESQQKAKSHTTMTQSIKDLTVIIKFNPDKTVKSYSHRFASF